MDKHTPGPWNIVDWKELGLAIHSPLRKIEWGGYKPIAEFKSGKSSPCKYARTTEDDANVQLMAAAPDLLDALQFVAKFYQDNFDAMPVAFQTVDDIVTAAIEKATKE